MDKTFYVLTIFQILCFVLIITFSIIYSIPLLTIRRFYSPVNIFTINASVTLLCCAIYWIAKLVLSIFYPDEYNSVPDLCTFQSFIQTFVLCQVVYALSLVSIHRLCLIVYPQKRLLQTKRWCLICIGCQWMFCIILSLPTFIISTQECNNNIPLWFNIYTLVIIALVPMILFGITNTFIFVYAYTSTRRVNPGENRAVAGHTRNIPALANRDARVLKHMLFMLVVYIGGWTPIYMCIVLQPAWFDFLTFYFMQLLPEISMLIDIVDLFIYNHQLRHYFVGKVTTVRRYVTNTAVLRTMMPTGQAQLFQN